MCNGANLAYTREAFNHVKGFEGIDDIASGDDMLVMYKIEKAFPGQTSYLKYKDAIVYTDGMYSIQSFLQQRIRWASKATKFKDARIQFILACVFSFNAFLLLVLFCAVLDIVYLKLFIVLLLTKGSIELSLLIPVSRFFKKEAELYYVYILQLIHIPYILISAVLSQFGTYSWKDRKVK
ncbi:MAG: hypothetical protein IPK62_16790 [Bacteroidetes bacterium]|nr:hypothetical protein [Bacteroidota bacterium]